MGAFENWDAQKAKLRQTMQDSADTAGIAYAVRHTLAQVEQNTMAEQTDDLLRQQTGILFSCAKVSANLLDVSVTAKVWVAQEPLQPKGGKAQTTLWLISALVLLGAGLLCYFTGQVLAWILIAAALCVGVAAFIGSKRRGKASTAEPQTKVTLRPDEERLFTAIDAQMQAIDRYINDFTYLNEQATGKQGTLPDGKTLGYIADMLEALYEHEENVQGPAIDAAGRMLHGMGVEPVAYAPGEGGLFTVLPSKAETRTMVPALVAADDHRLLRRGVAVVQMGSADGEESKAGGE